MQRTRRFAVGLMLLGVLTAGLAVNTAGASDPGSTSARQCLVANDVLCVTIHTSYNIVCGDVACTWEIDDDITGTGRLLDGELYFAQHIAPTETALSSCRWPGFPGATGCTHSRSYLVGPVILGSATSCKTFKLTSTGRARLDLLPSLPVSAVKTDNFKLCGNGSKTAI